MKVTKFSQVVNVIVDLYYKGFTNKMICDYIHYGNINSLTQFFLRLEKSNLIVKLSCEERRMLLLKNLKNLIIEDFNNGIDIGDIAKKYHVYETIVNQILVTNEDLIQRYTKRKHKLSKYNTIIMNLISEKNIKEIYQILKEGDDSITYNSLYYYITTLKLKDS